MRTSQLVIARSEAANQSSLSSLKDPELLRFARDDREDAEGRFRLHLEGLGWLDASIVSQSGEVLLARLQPSLEQRRLLVVRLFSSSHGAVADTARLGAALLGLARRAFLGR